MGGGVVAVHCGGKWVILLILRVGTQLKSAFMWEKETEETIYIHEEIISDGSKQNCRSAFFFNSLLLSLKSASSEELILNIHYIVLYSLHINLAEMLSKLRLLQFLLFVPGNYLLFCFFFLSTLLITQNVPLLSSLRSWNIMIWRFFAPRFFFVLFLLLLLLSPPCLPLCIKLVVISKRPLRRRFCNFFFLPLVKDLRTRLVIEAKTRVHSYTCGLFKSDSLAVG